MIVQCDRSLRTSAAVPLLLMMIGAHLLVAGDVSADWIHLKNGQKLQGEVLREENGHYVIRTEVPKGELRIRKERIRRIESEDDEDFTLDQARVKKGPDGYRDALDDVREVLEKNPDSRRARRVLRHTYRKAARHALRRRRLSRARTYVEKGLENFPDDTKLRQIRTNIRRRNDTVDNLQKRARKALQNKNYARAVTLYRRIQKNVPDQRSSTASRLSEALARLGVRRFRNEAYNRSLSTFREAVSVDPGKMRDVRSVWIRAALKRAVQLIRNQKYRDATSFLNEQIERFPDDRRLKFLLGTSFQYRGRIDRAAQIYSTLLERPVPETPDLGTLRRKAANTADVDLTPRNTSDRARVLPGDWRKKRTEHFTIYHRNHKIADRAADVLERSFTRIRKVFGPVNLPDSRTRNVYVYPTKKIYQKHSDRPNWSSGYTRSEYTSGELRYRILTYQQAPRLFESVLPHEVGHVVLGSVIGRRSPPLWLEEGVAVTFENAFETSQYRIQVRSARSEEQLPALEKLLNRSSYPDSKEKKSLFYAQSYSLVRFLLERKGWDALVKLAKTIHPNEPEEAFEEIYGFGSVDELQKAWHTHLSQN